MDPAADSSAGSGGISEIPRTAARAQREGSPRRRCSRVERATALSTRSMSLLPDDFELSGKMVDKDPYRRRQATLCHEYEVDRDGLRMPLGENAHEAPLIERAFDDLSRQQGNARSRTSGLQ